MLAEKSDLQAMPPPREPCPEEKANFLSRIFMLWVAPLIARGWKSPLQDADLWELRAHERGRATVVAVERFWNMRPSAGSSGDGQAERVNWLQWSVYRAFRRGFILVALLKFVDVILYVIQPLFIAGMIRFLSSPDEPVGHGYAWAAGLFLTPAIKVIVENIYFATAMRTGMRVRSSLQGILYEKSLRLSPSARASASLGQIVNLMQLDTQRIGDSSQFINVLWAAPIQIIVSVALLYRFIGPSAIIGFVCTLLSIPLQGLLFKNEIKMRKQTIGVTDKRVKLMNEILQGIKAIKFYAWERPFAENVQTHRSEEIKKYGSIVWIRSASVTLLFTFPIIIGVITFTFFTAVFRNKLTAENVITGITLLNQLRVPIMMFPIVFTTAIDARLGLKRIERLLNLEDTEDYARDKGALDKSGMATASSDEAVDDDQTETPATKKGFISITDGEFEWSQIAGNPLELEKKKRKGCLPIRRKRRGTTEDASSQSSEKRLPANGENVDANSDSKGGDGADGKYVSTLGSVLRDVNLNFSAGQLHAIVGQVGSGKSSLFHAMLGEMRKVKGSVQLEGSVAYVAQTAWIFHDTLRNNVTFGKPFDEELYNQAITVSALKPDIDILPAGDETSIGERGVNLSGGQKQRVSLARAVYAQADVYLFDDPLSALDAHVSQHVFDNCISNDGVLSDKLRILITNQVHVLPRCDSVSFISAGVIKSQGSFQQLAQTSAEFKTLVSEQEKAAKEQEENAKEETSEESSSSKDEDVDETENNDAVEGKKKKKGGEEGSELTDAISLGEKENDGKDGADGGNGGKEFKAGAKMMQEEERRTGEVGFKMYMSYARMLSHPVLFVILMLYFTFSTALSFIVLWWLAYWSEEESNNPDNVRSTGFFLGIYVAITAMYTLTTYTRSIWLYSIMLTAAKNLHNNMLSSLLRAPLTFFDTTPVGRILARFSHDMNALDEKLPQFFNQTLNTILSLLLTYVFIAYILPPFVGAAVPVLLLYGAIMYYFKRSLVELKRLDAISKSPIYAHFSETLGGLSTLRAYSKEEEARKTNMDKIDLNQRAFFSWLMSNRFFTVCLETCGSLLVLAAAIFAVVSRGQQYSGRVGLALTYALQVTSFLGFAVRSVTEMEGQMSSVERANHYVKELPAEAASTIEGATPAAWPERGEIEFKDVELRYRDELPLVLKGINLSVRGGEKIGIVGRTGSGKSSMMIALLRMVEVCGGQITVDGVDLKSLGLDDVRSKMTIIPQDPVMFSGTIRLNLDPTNQFSDAQLWDALEKSHLKQFVAAFDEGLDAPVSEYGENLSAGQRQIICLTRALLRNSKILILDEASSSLDIETDALIQQTIRTHLKHATILTIAHRLLTLADYDRIAVLESGLVAQYGTPRQLLEDGNGLFVRLVDSMGRSGAAHFRSKVMNSENDSN